MPKLGAAKSLRMSAQIQVNKASNWLLSILGDLGAQLEQPKWCEDPYPLYDKIRAKGPLHRSLSGMWMTASFDICNQILRDRRFGMNKPDGTRFSGNATVDLLQDYYPASFLDMDPPDHTRLRRIAAPAFSPRMINNYRDRIQKTVDGLIDQALDRKSFDVVEDIATPLPITVISDLLGMPESDRDSFARYGILVGSTLSGVNSLQQASDLVDVAHDLSALFERLVKERTENPGDDVISIMTTALKEDKLTAQELHGSALLLLIAGFETTVNLISNGVNALLQYPEQWALLRENPELASQTVEEVLRFDPSVQASLRVAHADIEIAGQHIKQGHYVGLLLAGANRDARFFENPNQFDITRDTRPEHISFSSGIHYCLGAPLARLESEIVFRSLVERMPLLQRAGSAIRRDTNSIRGFAKLPVTATIPAPRT